MTVGNIDAKHVKSLVRIISDVYAVCGAEAPEAVEVIFYSTRSLYMALMQRESERLGVKWWMDPEFIAYHDAWTGIPRIHVIIEVMRELPLNIFISTLIHEAAHTILHGSVESYIVSMPDPLATLDIPEDVKWRFLHLVSTGIKDYDVTLYVATKRLDSSLKEYVLHSIRLEDEDLIAASISLLSKEAMLLASASLLKSLTQAAAVSTANWPGSDRVVEEARRLAGLYPQPVREAAWATAFRVLPETRGSLQDRIDASVATILSKLKP